MEQLGKLIKDKVANKKKMFAWLIDPDKQKPERIIPGIENAEQNGVDFIFLGGSLLINDQMDQYIDLIKKNTRLPVILFPGGPNQIHPRADAILFLSLISGRNPDFLIGRHVEVASILKKTGIEVLPTGYILIESGNQTTASYVSNTFPIPSDKPEIALNTALAGELLGLRYIFLDGGSGAQNPVPSDVISLVKSHISIPLIVGGGIRTPEQMKAAYNSGADIIVIGNRLEDKPDLLGQFGEVTKIS